MEQKENKPSQDTPLQRLDKILTELGVKQGNFSSKNSTYLHVPKNEKKEIEVLSPAENVTPIEVGAYYKDYLLSNIVNSETRHLEYVSLLSRDNEVIITARLYDNSYSKRVRLMHNREIRISVDIIPPSGLIFGDAVIRYSNDTEEPYVVSLVCYDKSEFIKLSDFEK